MKVIAIILYLQGMNGIHASCGVRGAVAPHFYRYISQAMAEADHSTHKYAGLLFQDGYDTALVDCRGGLRSSSKPTYGCKLWQLPLSDKTLRETMQQCESFNEDEGCVYLEEFLRVFERRILWVCEGKLGPDRLNDILREENDASAGKEFTFPNGGGTALFALYQAKTKYLYLCNIIATGLFLVGFLPRQTNLLFP